LFNSGRVLFTRLSSPIVGVEDESYSSEQPHGFIAIFLGSSAFLHRSPQRLDSFAKGSVNVAEPTGGIMPDPITQRLAALPTLSKAGLCELWQQLFNTSPLLQLRKRLMVSILAYRLQEQAFGSLSAANRGRLHQLGRAFEDSSSSAVSSIPNLRPGTRLVRQWGDQVHLVNVEASGYEYQGARYQSLSEIARLITGTRWSGPLFFGIKSEQLSKSKEAQ
jgi:Protein of unknown function (DUF2924)